MLQRSWQDEGGEEHAEIAGDAEVAGEIARDAEVEGEIAGDAEVAGEIAGDLALRPRRRHSSTSRAQLQAGLG